MRRRSTEAAFGRVAAAAMLAAALAWLLPRSAFAAVILSDFDSGSVTLESYDPAEDLEPDAWTLTQTNTYRGSRYSLRIFGNTWKAQPIAAYPISRGTVFHVAVYVETKGEMQAFGISDGANSLLYTVAGTQLPTAAQWEATYQGAFATGAWQEYLLPVGRDWYTRYGYDPMVTRLVYVNDRDAASSGVTMFDAVEDVTSDLPVPPEVHIVTGAQKVTKLAPRLFNVGVQFHAQVDDPDSDTLSYHWDFGDSAASTQADPYHEYTVTSDYTFTVTLSVEDDTGLWGRDTTQVAVDPGAAGGPLTIDFVGDVMLARDYDLPGGLIDTYGVESIFEPTRAVYGDAADVSVCNLESPLTDQGVRHPTKSIVFRGRPANVAGLTYAGIDVVTIGNNHIIDYGQQGMDQTLDVLDAAAIRWSGAGDDAYIALEPVLWTERGVALAFLGQCNRTGREYNYQPFLDAAYNKPGFAYCIEPNVTEAITAAHGFADLVVMQMHAGIEYATVPEKGTALAPGAAFDAGDPPGREGFAVEPAFDAVGPVPGRPEPVFPVMPTLQERQLRWDAVDAGADLVICHHPHVLQGFEVRNGVLIAHSLGNFVFDQSYAETFPSIVLSAQFDKEGFRNFTFRPIFIDDKIPRPASGRLGREILDRQAEYSRPLGAIVSTDPATLTGTVHLDAPVWQASEWNRKAPLVGTGGLWVSPPIERTGGGMLARVLAVEGATGAEVRIGREILWHGDFEDEGATMWVLNSVDEIYDAAVEHQGARSLRQHRTSNNVGAVTTDLQGYPVTYGGTDYSVCGWIRTGSAVNARITARLYTGRGSGLLGDYDAGSPLSGTHDWTFTWADVSLGSAAAYFNVRPQMDKPTSGESYAWYDEVRLIEWEPWQLSFPLEVPYPNNVRFLQVRTSSAADSALVRWEDVSVETPSVAAPAGNGAPPPPSLRTPFPNPFSGAASIEYTLPAAGRVRLEVFDVTGRRIAVLADGERAPGTHRAVWDARRTAAGLYFVRLEAAGSVSARKLVVMH